MSQRAILSATRTLLMEGVDARLLVVVSREETIAELWRALPTGLCPVWVATTPGALAALPNERPLYLPYKLDRTQLISFAIVHGIIDGRIDRERPLTCLSEGHRGIDLLQIVTPAVDVELTGIADWTPDQSIEPEVLLAVLRLAVELGSDRTGRAAGTLFTVGDAAAVLDVSEPYPFEPFGACPPPLRQIKVAATQSAIQKYARVDGVFVVGGDGVVERFVKQVNPHTRSPHLDPSTGSRHAAAAGITLDTRAFALLVTESGGDVKLFKDGRILLVYKPR